MESNLNLPSSNRLKLNNTKIKSTSFIKKGDLSIRSPLKDIHKTMGKIFAHIRKLFTRIGFIEKKLFDIEKSLVFQSKVNEKINERLTKTEKVIEKIEKKNEKNKSFGQGEGKSDIEKSLTETNQILVQIQQELMRASALRSQEEKAKSDRAKRSSFRAKLGIGESQLEKSSKNIKSSVGEKAEETVAPVKGMFDRIMDFVGTLALGIAGNAIFGWLKNPENMEKVKGWFSWIKENWGWAVAAIGAIALTPLVGVITTIIGTLSLLAPLLIPIAPLLLKALAIVGGIVLAYKGLEAGFNAVRNSVTGGSEFSAAHDILDQKLKEAGLDQDGKKRDKGAGWDFLGWAGTRKEVEMTENEKKLAADVLAKRKQLNSMRDDMRGEIQKKNLEIDEQAGLTMSSSDSQIQATQSTRDAAEKEIRAKYAEKITQIVPLNIEAREKGGPVAAGKPYLVGEGGPELFSPNINGSIVNNMRTEKIYQMISSGRRGRGGINMINFPPITNQLPPPPLPNMSGGGEETEVPDISSTNMADPYRQLSPMLYGITV